MPYVYHRKGENTKKIFYLTCILYDTEKRGKMDFVASGKEPYSFIATATTPRRLALEPPLSSYEPISLIEFLFWIG